VLRANRILPIIHYRNLFVNRYPAIESKRWGGNAAHSLVRNK
jgi:hypothetical protein